jgi:hypothetical protein
MSNQPICDVCDGEGQIHDADFSEGDSDQQMHLMQDTLRPCPKCSRNQIMKPFEYYEEAPGVECYGYSWVNQQLKLYTEELAKIPLTIADRRERYAKRETELKAEVEKLNEPFLAAHAALKDEFWKDLREELGYDKLFNEAGVAYFEALVEEMKECRRHVPSLEETISSYYEDRYLQAKRLLVDYHSLRSQEIQKPLEFVSESAV